MSAPAQPRKTFPFHSIVRDLEWRDVCAALPRSVPWSMLEPHHEQAWENHRQTLERLAERGGLDPVEMWCVLEGKPWRNAVTMEVAVAYLLKRLENHDG